jgi:CheY-like chemotaxis protein
MRAKKRNQILVVDDDPEDHIILLDYFVEAGLDPGILRFKENGKKAIEYLNNITDDAELPKLIVLDMNMPVMNGTQTLLYLKQDAHLRKIPVIIYSTSDNEQEKRKCLSFGAADYVVKPMTYDEGRLIAEIFVSYTDLSYNTSM